MNLLKDLPSDVLDKILGYLGWMHLPSLKLFQQRPVIFSWPVDRIIVEIFT